MACELGQLLAENSGWSEQWPSFSIRLPKLLSFYLRDLRKYMINVSGSIWESIIPVAFEIGDELIGGHEVVLVSDRVTTFNELCWRAL